MALMACAAVCAFAREVIVVPVLMAYKVVERVVLGLARRVLDVVAPKRALDLNPVSLFAAAKSFYLRIVRRQRPHVTLGGRWCPST
jgi:hypothetical protein